MVDLGHLEKMGRELKCPICLSLLNSAASLGCNHVFCNSCILESMKSGSDCPVYKVPFRRRVSGTGRGNRFSLLADLGIFKLIDGNLKLICPSNSSHGVQVHSKSESCEAACNDQILGLGHKAVESRE